MRRNLFVIFMLLLIVNIFLIDRYKKEDISIGEYYKIEKTIMKIDKKEKFNGLSMGEFYVVDFNKSNLEEGQVVRLRGKIKILGNTNSYSRYLRSKGYRYILYLSEVESIESQNRLIRYRLRLKNIINQKIDSIYFEKAFIVKGILMSDKEDFDKDIISLFSKIGILHLFVASGLHMAIIVGAIDKILFFVSYKKRMIIIICVSFFYSFLIGFTPSIVRAFIFIIFFYLGFFLEKKPDAISILSLIGIISILKNPYCIFNLSLSLSIFSVLSIALTYKYIKNIIKNDLISISIAANILIIPLIYYFIGTISFITPISNLLLGGIGAILIPILIIDLLISFISLKLAIIISFFAKFIIIMILEISNLISKIPFVFFEFEKRSILFLYIYYFLSVLFIIIVEQNIIKEQFNDLQGYDKGNQIY